MGYPLGKAPLEDGTGTTPVDMQRIIGAQYATSGILPTGGVAVKGTSSMAYKITAGAVVLKTVAGLGMLHPVEEQTVNTLPAPATGSRQDRVVMDVNGAISITSGPAPGGGITLGLFTVPAGVTSTSAAVQSIDRNYAIPAGASLGRLAHWVDPGGAVVTTSEQTRTSKRFFLPSDRMVRVDLLATVRAATATPGSMRMTVKIDSDFTKTLWVPYGAQWTTTSGSWSVELREGAHTVTVSTGVVSGGLYQMSEEQSASEMNVWDAGVAE